ncbi:MAG: hypothetical protein ABSF21_03400 [Dehalococcoidia bacterium]
MSKERWTENEVDAIVEEVRNLDGLPDEQVAEGKANIEAKYDLPPGMLSKSNPSTITPAEVERQKIYPQHYEATMEEVGKMTPDEYKRWRDLGAHFQKPVEEIQRDAIAEERNRVQADENALVDKMSMQTYIQYKQDKAEAKQKAEQEEAAEVARVAKEAEEKAARELGYKSPEEMTMREYLAWRNK